MQLAILADVHGNHPGLEAILAGLPVSGVERVLVAGDLTAGPYPNETLARLRDLEAWMILGNSDLNLLRFVEGRAPDAWRTHKQFGLLRWNARNISTENLEFLRGLPEQGVFSLPGYDPIRVVHGTPRDPYEPIYPALKPAILDLSLGMVSEPVLVCGHTHEPWCLRRNGRLALNPGSVAGPLNGEVGAQYALLSWESSGWQVELKTVPYDLARLREAFETSGLLNEGGGLARAFLASIETGRNTGLAFLSYAYRLAEQSGYPDCQVLPDEIWDQASESFPFEGVGEARVTQPGGEESVGNPLAGDRGGPFQKQA